MLLTSNIEETPLVIIYIDFIGYIYKFSEMVTSRAKFKRFTSGPGVPVNRDSIFKISILFSKLQINK